MTNKTITQSAPLFSSIKYKIEVDGPIVVADGFKSPENMGHLIRLASNFGAIKVIFIGEEQSVRHSKIKRVAGAAAGQVDWIFCTKEDWMNQVPQDYTIAAIETTEDSLNIANSQLPKKLALVMGNEIKGLSEEVLSHCQQCYHIPMIGAIKSMNVSHACSVALYEWVKQFHKVEQ
ncbi:TrmH family RNA methyltransferase [Labilibacter marinus]|uniref:TrmH family RNA methyltransferase n=1 Tax=Labilibacter marinus TaxID=1477105 RepID=UPI00094FD90E|nr:TrmH family RNA methyltransferase [Labilibacter marinus]